MTGVPTCALPICGYIRNADVVSGVKFVVVLQTIALLVWMVVG